MSATRTYSPPLPKIPAGDIFRTDPRGLPVPDPCPHTYGVRVGPCRASATEPCRPTACISAAPFRHTPCRFRPRQKATVWRNLLQHPQSDITTTTLHSPFSILHSSFSYTFLRKRTRHRNRPILLWRKVLQLRFEHLAQRRSDE